MNEILAFIAGLLAVGLYIAGYQIKKRSGIILCNASSRFFYIAQYLLLGAFEGAIMDLLGLFASLPARWKEQPQIKRFLPLILAVIYLPILIAGILLYENFFSLFALFGVLLETGALWFSKERQIRLVSLLSAPCWLIYNLSAGAWGSVIGNTLAIASLLLAIYRYDRKKET